MAGRLQAFGYLAKDQLIAHLPPVTVGASFQIALIELQNEGFPEQMGVCGSKAAHPL
jgi:hypothetical protein